MAWSFTVNASSSAVDLVTPGIIDATVTTGADTYATGGMALVELAKWFSAVATAELITETGAYTVAFSGTSPTTGLLLVYVQDGTDGNAEEVANSADLSSAPGTLRVRFRGTMIGRAYASANGVQ